MSEVDIESISDGVNQLKIEFENVDISLRSRDEKNIDNSINKLKLVIDAFKRKSSYQSLVITEMQFFLNHLILTIREEVELRDEFCRMLTQCIDNTIEEMAFTNANIEDLNSNLYILFDLKREYEKKKEENSVKEETKDKDE